MITKFIEATNGPRNWGKFMVGRFTLDEWQHLSEVSLGRPLLTACGWTGDILMVLDLQTGEGAVVTPGGNAAADLDAHKIWVCPMMEPFLTWLYTQDLENLSLLPNLIDLPEAPFAMSGYRRKGKTGPLNLREVVEAPEHPLHACGDPDCIVPHPAPHKRRPV